MGGLLGKLSGRTQAPNGDYTGSPEERAEQLRKDGNVLCNKGALADSCVLYELALRTLKEAEEPVEESQKDAISQMRLALHLNLALTHIRRGSVFCNAWENVQMPAFTAGFKENLKAAIDHSESAVAMDPLNEKGLLRRGTARSRLAEMEENEELAEIAAQDLEKVLEINPECKEAQRQLNASERMLHDEKRKREKSLKDMIRPDGGDYRPIVSAEGVNFVQGEDKLVVNVSLDLLAGRCLGLLGDTSGNTSAEGESSESNYARGKFALVNIFSGKEKPSGGRVVHHGKVKKPSGASVSTASVIIVATMCMVIYLLALMGKNPFSAVAELDETGTWVHAVVTIAVAWSGMMLLQVPINRRNSSDLRHSVLHVNGGSFERSSVLEDFLTKTVEQAISEKLSSCVPCDQHRSRTIAMLKAAGFKEELGATRFDSLSGDQKQVITLLRSLAASPDVLICDEVLRGLDVIQRARILHMLRRMKEEIGTAILYTVASNSDVSEFRLIADSLGHLCDGSIVELGPAVEILDSPKSSSTHTLIASCEVKGEKLAEKFRDLKSDPSLAGDWMPH